MFKKISLSILSILLIVPAIYHLVLFSLPTLNIWMPNTTILLSNDGQRMSVHNDKNEEYVYMESLDENIPKYLIGLEDQDFYSHHGISYKRIIKSAIDNFKNNKVVSGGSTITQQLARILYLDNSKTFTRKMREYNYAKRLERSLSKDEILEVYLNSVFFGKNLYGIESASNYYFSKSASELSASEAISLFAILKSPNSLNPETDYEAFTNTYKNAVYNLYMRNVISVQEYYDLYEDVPKPKIDENQSGEEWYYQGIKRELKRYSNYETMGYSVETTIDFELQKDIEDIIRRTKNSNSNEEVAIVVLSPNDGSCLALIGGTKNDYNFNRALDGVTQIGSTVKPLLYTIALEKGFTPLSKFVSEPTTFHIDGVGDYTPSNATDTYAYKPITMVEALSLSDNIYATKTTLVIGSKSLSNRLKVIGIEKDNYSVSDGLGSFSLSPFTLTSLYNCLANKGIYNEPYFIKSIKTKNKTIYQKSDSYGIRLFEKEKTLMMSHMLLSPYDQAFVTYANPTMLGYSPNCRFAVKTGSTESSSIIMSYNPSYTLGIYVGTDDNSTEYDKTLAKRLFVPIANRLMEGKRDTFYESTSLKPFTLTNTNNNIKSFTYYR